MGEKYFYCPVYKMDRRGFSISKRGNNYFLNYKKKNENEVSIKISKKCFDVLKSEWK